MCEMQQYVIQKRKTEGRVGIGELRWLFVKCGGRRGFLKFSEIVVDFFR